MSETESESKPIKLVSLGDHFYGPIYFNYNDLSPDANPCVLYEDPDTKTTKLIDDVCCPPEAIFAKTSKEDGSWGKKTCYIGVYE